MDAAAQWGTKLVSFAIAWPGKDAHAKALKHWHGVLLRLFSAMLFGGRHLLSS